MEHLIDLLLGPSGLVVFVLFVLFAGWKGWWIWGRDYDKLEQEKNEWKEAALRGTRLAEHAVSRVKDNETLP